MTSKPILLFDGVCNLCNGVVQFVIKNDPEGKYQFASLQSGKGQELLEKYNLPTDAFESFVLVEDNKVFQKSSAALTLFGGLGGIWKLTKVFWVVPRFLRDWVYSLIANNRYKMFGRKDECWLPTPELKSRFLE